VRARDYCAERLRSAGFSISEEPFSFSSFPAQFVPPAVGVIAAGSALLAAHLVTSHRIYQAAIWLIVVALFVWAGSRVLLARGVGRMSALRRSTANLVATRGSSTLWLVAHLDSKSQTVPMLFRIAGVAGVVLAVATMVMATSVASVAQIFTSSQLVFTLLDPVVRGSTIVCVVSAIPLALCWIGDRSAGALDNASGVATVLLAAESDTRLPLNVLITSAEELGLAGARAFAARRLPGLAINCDTIDDEGSFLVMSSERASRSPRRMEHALQSAADKLGIRLRSRGMLPGVLTDSIALTDCRWEAVTVSRGNLATLGRVHTSRDTPDQITGTGIALASRLLAATIEELV